MIIYYGKKIMIEIIINLGYGVTPLKKVSYDFGIKMI
jgi:hypothetical protein